MKAFKKMTAGLLLVPLLGLGGCSFFEVVKDIGIVAGAIAGGHSAVGILLHFAALPPASDLASFDANQASENLQVSNTAIAKTSGNVTVEISDQSSGSLLGKKTFAYRINSAHHVLFSNPSSATSWVRSFSHYGGYVKVDYKATVLVKPPGRGQSARVTATGMYRNTPYASGSVTISGNNPVHCPNPRYCEPY